jgi:dihydrodipicolinate synthase/N-acetylneuraminate lyase
MEKSPHTNMQYVIVAKYETADESFDKIMYITNNKTAACNYDVSAYTADWEVWIEVYDTALSGYCQGLVNAIPIYPKGNLYE